MELFTAITTDDDHNRVPHVLWLCNDKSFCAVYDVVSGNDVGNEVITMKAQVSRNRPDDESQTLSVRLFDVPLWTCLYLVLVIILREESVRLRVSFQHADDAAQLSKVYQTSDIATLYDICPVAIANLWEL